VETWEISAREHVRQLIAAYAHLVDGGRFDELVELFTEDATLEAGTLPPAHGRDAIRAVFTGTGARLAARAARPLIRHHVSSIQIDVHDADTAGARAYFCAFTARGPDHWGRYRDRLVRRDGRWLFHHRRVETHGRAGDSVLGPGGTD
jgi:3-phenylpropionate/cinnamic acid dioxygenase small subunit